MNQPIFSTKSPLSQRNFSNSFSPNPFVISTYADAINSGVKRSETFKYAKRTKVNEMVS